VTVCDELISCPRSHAAYLNVTEVTTVESDWNALKREKKALRIRVHWSYPILQYPLLFIVSVSLS